MGGFLVILHESISAHPVKFGKKERIPLPETTGSGKSKRFQNYF